MTGKRLQFNKKNIFPKKGTISDLKIKSCRKKETERTMIEKPSKNGLAKCHSCGIELIAPYDGQPYWCTECSYEEELKERAKKIKFEKYS